MANDKDNKTVNINLRVSESTKKELLKLADSDRRTLSDYIRLQLEKLATTNKK
jgi:mRNA-degrading endonuclease RelE of RelBE toxin-antitoxin system